MISVLDVFDNFLGESDCRAAARLSEGQLRDLSIELERYYESWIAPLPIPSAVFSGSWAAHNASIDHGRTILGNDLLLFDRVAIHDPIEPYVSRHSQIRRPVGLPALSSSELALAWVEVPANKSGRRPQISTALFPPRSTAFLAISEAEEFSRRDWRDPSIKRALEALEQWRPLISMGAIALVPAIEVTRRETPGIATEGQRNIKRVAAALDTADGHELTSFFSRGLNLIPGSAYANNAARDRARHVSWVYARELAIAAAGGAAYATEFDIDRAIVRAMLIDQAPATVIGPLADAVTIELPGFSEVSFADIAAIRRDEQAFAELRRALTTMITSTVVELEQLPAPERQRRIAEHLQDELNHVQQKVRESRVSWVRRFVPDLLTLGVPLTASVVTHDIAAGTAVGAGVSLLRRMLERRPKGPDDRALLWLSRHLSN